MFTRTRLLPRWIAAFLILPALSALRADPSVTLAPGAAAQTLDLELTDSTNATWTLQTSTDLATWQDRTTFRVHNTVHTFTIENAASGPAIFFRFLSAAGVTQSEVSGEIKLYPGRGI